MQTSGTALERLASFVTVVVSLGFAAAAFWELGGPLGSGHVAAQAGVAMAAENMLRWGIIAPVPHVTLTAPTSADWYCHHPFGIFWWQVPFTALLGHRDLALRVPAAVLSAATPPLLYALGRRLWNPIAGMVCAAAFAALPIALAFADFNALEVPVIFWVLLSMLGTVGFAQTKATRWLALSLGALGCALNADWSAWFFVGPVVLVAGPHALREKGRVRTWWALSVALLLGTALFYLVLFGVTGQLHQLLDAGRLRSSGGAGLGQLLEARRNWLELCFTPVALTLGAVATPVVLARAVVRRRAIEALPLAVLTMALVQYLAFPNGADTHIFWPHLFAPWFALAMGAVAATITELGAKRARGASQAAALLAGLGVCGLMLPDGLRALEQGRRTGLRFDEKGRFIEPDLDKEALMRWLSPQLPADQGVFVHASLRSTFAVDWALERATRGTAELEPQADDHWRLLVADRRLLPGDALAQVASRHAVRAVGPYLVVDLASPPGPAQGFSFTRREPTTTERVWRSDHAPVMHVVADPYATWELRQLIDDAPPPAPTEAPSTLSATVTAHNAALANGDTAAANRWLNGLRSKLDQQMAQRLPEGLELLGVSIEPGVSPVFHVIFRADGPLTPDAWFFVRARPLATPALSTVRLSTVSRLVAPRFQVPSSRWKPGFLYESVIELAPGVGRERYLGSFIPGETGGTDQGIALLELEGR